MEIDQLVILHMREKREGHEGPTHGDGLFDAFLYQRREERKKTQFVGMVHLVIPLKVPSGQIGSA